MEMRNGTILTRSGAQVSTATYTVRPQRTWLVVQLSNHASNGQPNCQGITAEVVSQHLVTTMYVKIVADTLLIFIHPSDANPFVRATRVR